MKPPHEHRITIKHRERMAIVYVRQSVDSTRPQFNLRHRAVELEVCM